MTCSDMKASRKRFVGFQAAPASFISGAGGASAAAAAVAVPAASWTRSGAGSISIAAKEYLSFYLSVCMSVRLNAVVSGKSEDQKITGLGAKAVDLVSSGSSEDYRSGFTLTTRANGWRGQPGYCTWICELSCRIIVCLRPSITR